METSETTNTPKNAENKIKQKQWSKKKVKFAQELTEMGFSELLVIEVLDNVGDVDDIPITQFVVKLLTECPKPIENIPVVEDDGDQLWEDITDYNNMMVIVINTGLNMNVGKIAGQAVHAALGLYALISTREDLINDLIRWNNRGCPKIVLEVNNNNQLFGVFSEGKIHKIPFYCVYNFGLKLDVKLISFNALAFFGSNQELEPVIGQLGVLENI